MPETEVDSLLKQKKKYRIKKREAQKERKPYEMIMEIEKKIKVINMELSSSGINWIP